MNEQNESPFGNKRFIISILVVFIFLWGWQAYMSKKYPQAPAAVVQTTATPTTNSAESAPAVGSVQPTSLQASAPKIPNELKNQDTKPEQTLEYEDDNYKWTLSSVGMGLSSFTLKKYTDTARKLITYSTDTNNFSMEHEGKPISFVLERLSETEFRGRALIGSTPLVRTLTFDKTKGVFNSKTEFDKGLSGLSMAMADVKLTPKSSNFLMPSFEKQDFLLKEGEKIRVEHISGLADGESFKAAAAKVLMASINSQYFSLATVDQSDVTPSARMSVENNKAQLNLDYALSNTQVASLQHILFIGPKSTDALASIHALLPEVMDYGMFGVISKALLDLMKFLHGLLGNWGLAIIALTLVLRTLVLPLNIMSFKSSRALQKIQPQLQELRTRYKSDPMQLNKETMALMKKNNANPLSGCLPMLVQIPIFFALWKTIGSSIEIYQQPFFGWITDLSSYDHFFVLPVLMGITMYFQQKLTPTTMDPAQQKILNFMPILFTVFMISLPSGLTLYNFITSLFGVVQQYFLLRDVPAKKTA